MTGIVTCYRPFHLYDLGSQVGQHHRAKRAGENAGEIKNPDSFQSFHGKSPPPNSIHISLDAQFMSNFTRQGRFRNCNILT
jgi:hypothetical protein